MKTAKKYAHVRIVRSDNASKTAQALRHLADQADQGKLVGVAVAGILHDRTTSAHLGGLCSENHAVAIGGVAKLFHRLIGRL